MMQIKKGTVIEPYCIDFALPQGRGGMAQIYVAHVVGDSRKVALKISRGSSNDSRYENALRAEASILKNLGHPGIVKILPLHTPSKYGFPMERAFNIKGEPWYFAMEYLDGKSLHAYTAKSKGLPLDISCSIISHVASALMHVHEQGYAHLDVKPENIVFRYPLKRSAVLAPVLVDFGVAANVKGIYTDGGSLAFMPPERIKQVEGRVAPEYAAFAVDPVKVDIYGLGVLAFELVTGKLPFQGGSPGRLTSAILNHALTPPRQYRRDLHPAMESLILQMLDADPGQRPHLSQVVNELRRISPQVECVGYDVPFRK